MGEPHDPSRYGQTWDRTRIARQYPAVRVLREHAVFSGGWAWHFMAPAGHTEYRHGHDHKDIDAFVPYSELGSAVRKLEDLGFSIVETGYDAADFRRLDKKLHDVDDPQTLRVDLFMGGEPARQARGNVEVVAPERILEFYDQKRHGSGKCLAAECARDLLCAGDDPVGHPELGEIESYMN